MVKTFPVPCTKEEINKMLDAVVVDDFYYTLFYIAKSTGRRLGELVKVRVKDINYENKTMMTQVLKRRKRVEKEAILDPTAIQLLRKLIGQNKLKLDDLVFGQYKYRTIQKAVEMTAKEAGIPHKVSFHNFRHYFVTELLKQGWSYDRIAKLTGHSTPATLVSYDHAVAADIKEDALEALKRL